MEEVDVGPLRAQGRGKPVGLLLLVDEDQDLRLGVLLQQLPQQPRDKYRLVGVIRDINSLLHRSIGMILVRLVDNHSNRASHKLPSHVQHLFTPRCPKQRGEAVRSRLRQQGPDLGSKPKVKHPVSLVHDSIHHPVQPNQLRLHELNHAARSADEHLSPAEKVQSLIHHTSTLTGSPVGHADTNVSCLGVLQELGVGLRRQLPCWTQEKYQDLSFFDRRLIPDMHECRKTEREGLAAASLRKPNTIVPGEKHRPCLCLDRSWSGVLGRQQLVHIFTKVNFAKLSQRSWNLEKRLHAHIVLGPPLFRLSISLKHRFHQLGKILSQGF
eukprot:RCo055762